MNSRRFIRNNLIYYWKKHLLLALGVAISGAVITGALLVGDSVQYSLKRIVEERLGEVSHVLKAGDRYFTSELAKKVSEDLEVPVSSMLVQRGTAIGEGGQLRVNHVQVLGVDENFDQVAGLEAYFSGLSGDTIVISRNLANRLNKRVGDDLLLRIEKASLIPLNAPFVSDAEVNVTLRAVIWDVVDEEHMGRFNLEVSQTAPYNVFISVKKLQALMDFEGRVNVMLVADQAMRDPEKISGVVDRHFTVKDAGLKVEALEMEAGEKEGQNAQDPGESEIIQVTSDRVFIDENLTQALLDVGVSEGIITYFVNRFQLGDRITPYSFVSTLPPDRLGRNEIIINRWLARDLNASPGDIIRVSWFEVGPLRELEEVSFGFTVKEVVEMEGRFADASLMPDLPGLSDAGNCRDWDTGVPIELGSIRDKDEDYWDDFGGLPKAYISLELATEIWKNRFGVYTSIRYRVSGEFDQAMIEAPVADAINPAMLGFTLEATRSKGEQAAGEGVDFSELFAGLSFFLLVAGILLAILLFLLNIESREPQLLTLVTLGIPGKLIRRMMFLESMIVALAGSLLALVLAVFYNRLVFVALNGIWKDVVRTEMMHVDVSFLSLLTGFAISMVIAIFSFWFPLNKKLARLVKAHSNPDKTPGKSSAQGLSQSMAQQLWQRLAQFLAQRMPGRKPAALIALVSGLTAIAMILSQFAGKNGLNSSLFFPAGGLLLIAAVSFFSWFMGKREQASTSFSFSMLSWKNASRNRTRSMSIVILFSIGAFLVISTGSNRKDLFASSDDPSSGTGGFLYYARSTMPVLRMLNDPAVRYDYGIEGDVSFVQMRLADGDDASCLNLNRIVTPRVLGLDPESLKGRFSFVTRMPLLDEEDPWSTLQQELPGGLIPAIADETVIKYGLGMSVGDTLRYTNSTGGSMELLLVGGMAPSVFQGSVLISNENFLDQYPESSGTHVFLVDAALADTALISAELTRGMRDLGWDMQLCSERLAEFNSVTNAYLSIFMLLGALGLLLGTFGLVVVLSRSIMERRQEIALLKAVGYSAKQIRRLISREYFILLIWGILSGFGTAIIATLPSILSAHSGTSFSTILIWLLILVANGWFWIRVLTTISLKNPHIYEGLRNE